MASNRQAQSSDDEDDLVFRVIKTKRKRQTVLSSDDSDEDSDVPIRPRTRRRTSKNIHIFDSGSDDDDDDDNKFGNRSVIKKHKQKLDGESKDSASGCNSSDSEQSDKCAICLSTFVGQDLGMPETCDHVFCCECLEQWAKKVNTCPIDRKKFSILIVKKHGSSKTVKKMLVDGAENPEFIEMVESDVSDLTYCEMCGESDNEESLLLCDECELGFHCECLRPPLHSIPDGRWYCPYCELREKIAQDFHSLLAQRFRRIAHLRSNAPSAITSLTDDTREASLSTTNRASFNIDDLLSTRVTPPDSEDHAEASQITSRPSGNFHNRRQRLPRIQNYNQGSLSRLWRPFATSSTVVFESETNSGEELEFNYVDVDDRGNVLASMSHRSMQPALARRKSLMSDNILISRSSFSAPHSFRQASSSSPSNSSRSNSDIVGEILQMQTLLHGPISRSTSHLHKPCETVTNYVIQQCPLNPSHSTPSKFNNSEALQQNSANSSSSSSASTSRSQDLNTVQRDNVFGDSVISADGYESDSLSLVTHRSYGSASIPDEFRRDCQSRDPKRNQSDDDVDIYSDIEMANNEEASLDADVQVMNATYESDESRIPLPPQLPTATSGDGTDSSDNDLIIDEDVHADEDVEKTKSMVSNAFGSVTSNSPLSDGNSTTSDDFSHTNCMQQSGETYVEKGSHSPEEDELNSQDASSDVQELCDDSMREGSVEEDDDDDLEARNESDIFNSQEQMHGENEKKEIPEDSFEEKSDEWNMTNSSIGDESCDQIQADPVETGSQASDEELLENKCCDASEIEVGENLPGLESEGKSLDNVQSQSDESGEECEEIPQGNEMKNCEEFKEVNCVKDIEECPNHSDANSCSAVSSEELDKDEMYLDSEKMALDTPTSDQEQATSEESYMKPGHSIMNEKNPASEDILENDVSKHMLAQDRNIDSTSLSNTLDKDKFSFEEAQATSNIDLGIEDISDVASDELNQPENADFDLYSDNANQISSIEQNLERLFESNESGFKNENKKYDTSFCSKNSYQRYSSFRHSNSDDREEGEIIEETAHRHKEIPIEHYQEDPEEYMDSTPRMNISDLPRIPKIKKKNLPEEPPLEVKRLSVLGRIDLGSSGDISWKRLSQHTRERSYRDGRPKDESVLFREREPRSSKSKKNKGNSNDQRNEECSSERNKRDDTRKQESGRSKDRNDYREKKLDKNRNDVERGARQDDWNYGYSEKKEREKSLKSHKDKSKKDKEKKKEKRDKSKDKNSRDHEKYDKDRSEDRYSKGYERYEQSDDRYERTTFEKSREKEHKHKHHKSESKKCKEEKHKHSHCSDHYHYEKQRDREVRKIDDKIKVVVEHKDPRKEKEKDKVSEKKDFKYEKKHSLHHHQCKKKEVISSPYSEVTPIESKEIFAQGDSIIINVNFNRSSPKELQPSSEESLYKDQNSNSEEIISPEHGDLVEELQGTKSRHSFEKDRVGNCDFSVKRPSTPVDRIEGNQVLPVGEHYWVEGEDDATDMKSPSVEKSDEDKLSSEDENSVSPGYEGVMNDISDSNDGNSRDPIEIHQNEGEPSVSPLPCGKISSENLSVKDKETETFVTARRRSPHPPSPPSPPDNDSYDPCEPTKSPSPVPSSPVMPPLPSSNVPDRPKPPPEPELPPLPPEPEPSDLFPPEDIKPSTTSISFSSSDSSVPMVSSPVILQKHESYCQTTVESSAPLVNTTLPPPPSFPPQSLPLSKGINISNTRLITSKNTWQLPNPPPPPVVFSAQPVIRGTFLPSQFPTMGIPPPTVSGNILASTAPVPLLSPIRHIPTMQNNQLIGSLAVNHLNVAHLQVPQVSHSVMPHHPMPSSALGPHQVVPHMLGTQSHSVNITAAIHTQNMTVASSNKNAGSHICPLPNQPPPPTVPLVTTIPLKNEKLVRSPSMKEKSEVVDMDVDSPYSPGDSPSVTSSFDFSPPASPAADPSSTVSNLNASVNIGKDSFDSLFDSKVQNKIQSKSRLSTNPEIPMKKPKLEVKAEPSNRSRHSVRLQLTDKSKLRKEKHLEKKEPAKLDESQLKILDELPSSAVEMQVKEKFLKKLNRQERVVEEVKLALKPYYKTRDVSKEEYKDILRKSVPKICHNKSGEINPQKVKHLVECYVKKVKHAKKKAEKRHKSAKFS